MAKAKVGKRKAKKPYWQCNNLKQNFIDEDMCSERPFAIMLISYRKWTTWFSVSSTLYFHKTKNMTSNGIFLLCYMILVTHVLKTTNRHGRNINWIKPLQAFRLHCNLSSIKGVQGSLQTFNGYKAASCTGESRNFDLNFCVREEEYIYLISLRCSLFPLCTFRQLKFCLGVPVRSSHRAFIKAGHFLIISESMIIKLFSGYLSRTSTQFSLTWQ